jgi:hypothetical protein
VRTGTEQRLAAEVRRLRFALNEIARGLPEPAAIAKEALKEIPEGHRSTWREARMKTEEVRRLRSQVLTEEEIGLALNMKRPTVHYYLHARSKRDMKANVEPVLSAAK